MTIEPERAPSAELVKILIGGASLEVGDYFFKKTGAWPASLICIYHAGKNNFKTRARYLLQNSTSHTKTYEIQHSKNCCILLQPRPRCGTASWSNRRRSRRCRDIWPRRALHGGNQRLRYPGTNRGVSCTHADAVSGSTW